MFGPPQLLKRELLSAESSHCEDLQDLLGGVNPSLVLYPGRDHLTLIPPLQLSQTDAGQASYISAQEDPLA